MDKLLRSDLLSLEIYAEVRKDFRAKVMRHKQNRHLSIGPNATLYFEDRLTIQYQVQEILRVEKIFESEGIEEELQAYNPLIPDGTNWKSTFMLEFEDVDERKQRLSELLWVETRLWMQVAGCGRIAPICNEDLERTTHEKTSSVHFVRFELTSEMIQALKKDATISAGIDHREYQFTVNPIAENIRQSLINDLN